MPSLQDTPHLVDLIGLAIATASGLLIGLERETHDEEADRAGVRTLALVGLAGGVGGLLARSFGGWALMAIAAPVATMLLAARLADRRERRGITTEIAAVVVMGLGMLCTARIEGLGSQDRWTLVAAAAVVTLVLLSTRSILHRLAAHVSRADLYATGRLGVLLVIVLPLLPREPVGPIPGLVPFEVALMVSLVMAIGFVAYVGVRARGPRQGLMVAGGLGGLASSTAVTLEFARRVRGDRAIAGPAAAGIVLAAAAMVPRQLIEVAVVAPGLLKQAALPLGALGVAALAAAFVAYKLTGRGGADEDDGEAREGEEADDADRGDAAPVDAVSNPSSLGSALKFGGIFVVVVALTELARGEFGETGLYVSALVGGLTDADAITLAVGRMWQGGDVEPGPAVLSLVIGAGSNTLVKIGIGAVIGGARLGLWLLATLGPAVALALGLALFV